MKIYFLSSRTAGLKLNGVYLGLIDKFERFVNADLSTPILAEAVPEGNAQTATFFIDENFLKNPPDFVDVYSMGGDVIINIVRYAPKDEGIKVIAQKMFAGMTVTLFLNGGLPCLIAEGATVENYTLSEGFARASLSENKIGGRPVLLVEGEGCLSVLSETGKRVFYNAAESWQTGDRLEITVAFNTCAGCKAHCFFEYDGAQMKLAESKTEETVAVKDELLHFAFFESVMTRADCGKYLCEELKPRAGELYSFLGEFVDVSVPPQKFCEEHPSLRAAGLTYPLAANRYEIKFFAVDVDGGKITNVYEVED